MSKDLTFSDYSCRLGEYIRRSAIFYGGPTSERDLEFNALALELFALQFAHVAPYRNFCRARNKTPECVAFWEEIPALPISTFKEFEVSSLESGDRSKVFHSSGTTQHRPSKHYHNAASLALYEASLLATFKAGLLGGSDDRLPFITLTPPPDAAPHSSLAHMFETARRAFGTNDSVCTGSADGTGAWTLDFEKTESALRACIQRNQALVLLGTAFSFVHLLDHFQHRKARFSLPKGSCILETGGYKGRSRALSKSNLHSLIGRHLGVALRSIVSEYGMCELSSQAYDSIAGDASAPAGSPASAESCPRFRFPPWARVQIVSPENGTEVHVGETGIIRLFDLANVRSVMAIQTEDLGIRAGDGFELLGRAAVAEARGCSLMVASQALE